MYREITMEKMVIMAEFNCPIDYEMMSENK